MKKFGDGFRSRRKFLLSAAGMAALSVPIVLGLISGSQSWAQPQSQDSAAGAPKFEFDVASIKPSKPDAVGGFMTIPGPGNVSDSFTARNFTLMTLIRAAYGIPLGAEDSPITGGPSWLNSEKYDVEAKIDSAVLEELKKLSPEQRTLVQQQMLQALLAERFNLTVRRETKELPIYTLVIAKNGPKLQESKPDDGAPVGTRGPGGRRGRGLGMMGLGGPVIAQSVAIPNLVRLLSMVLGRPVLDKTGLTGKYDFTLKWTPDESQGGANAGAPGGLPNGQPAIPAEDPSGASLFTAIQEQLGLKLESGKGPVEIIMIERAERPSGN